MFTKNSDQNQVELPSKLSEIEAARTEIVFLLQEYSDQVKRLYTTFDAINLYASDVGKRTSFYDGSVEIDAILLDVDRRLWDYALSSSNVSKILSSEGEAELRKRYQENPAPFTAAEAERFLSRLAENSGAIAASTIRRIFDQLVGTTFQKGHSWRNPREKRSHDKIRESFRFSHFYGVRYFRDDRVALFNDLELVCRMINHLPKLERPNRIGDRMHTESWQGFSRPAPWKYTAEHFEVTLFKNGNVKLDFLCQKTLDVLNRYGSDGKSLVDPFGDQPNK